MNIAATCIGRIESGDGVAEIKHRAAGRTGRQGGAGDRTAVGNCAGDAGQRHRACRADVRDVKSVGVLVGNCAGSVRGVTRVSRLQINRREIVRRAVQRNRRAGNVLRLHRQRVARYCNGALRDRARRGYCQVAAGNRRRTAEVHRATGAGIIQYDVAAAGLTDTRNRQRSCRAVGQLNIAAGGIAAVKTCHRVGVVERSPADRTCCQQPAVDGAARLVDDAARIETDIRTAGRIDISVDGFGTA